MHIAILLGMAQRSTDSPEDWCKRFGRRVQRLRHDLGLSQEELAHRCGLHRTYVGSVERGERNISLVNICRLAKSLGVVPAELFRP